MLTLVLATRNQHKVGEIRAILGEQFCHRTLADLDNPPEVIEDAGTFAGNATKKAVELARWMSCGGWPPRAAGQKSQIRGERSEVRGQVFVLADDSGLEVDALGGAPGVHSARFAALDTGAAGNSSTADNNAKLLRLLKDVALEARSARFHCVLALAPVPGAAESSTSPVCYAEEAELRTELFDGTCEGHIDYAPRGQNGFGYDPLFVPAGHTQTFAELGEEVKNRLSHRAQALTRLKERLRSL
jgi:XTP/dITP diphosphohydrolase